MTRENASMSKETKPLFHPELNNTLQVKHSFCHCFLIIIKCVSVTMNWLTDGSSSFTSFVLPLVINCGPRHSVVAISPFKTKRFSREVFSKALYIKYNNAPEDLQGFPHYCPRLPHFHKESMRKIIHRKMGTTCLVYLCFYMHQIPRNVNIYPGQIHQEGRMWAKQDARWKTSWSIKRCTVGCWKLPSGTSASWPKM